MRGLACWGPGEPLLFGAWACTLPSLRRFSSSSDRSSTIWVKTHSDKGERNVFLLSSLYPAPTETCSMPPVKGPSPVVFPLSWTAQRPGRVEAAGEDGEPCCRDASELRHLKMLERSREHLNASRLSTDGLPTEAGGSRGSRQDRRETLL